MKSSSNSGNNENSEKEEITNLKKLISEKTNKILEIGEKL